MTREQLDAIRARVERHDAATLYHAPTDLRALLAEVERLTAERNGARAEVAFLKRHYSMEAASRLRAELATAKAKVDLLTAEVEKINPCRLIDVGDGGMSRERVEADAFRRGVAAMREEAASIFDAPVGTPGREVLLAYADAVRVLPAPKDK